MATPALRSIRAAMPGALIAALMRPALAGLLDGLPWIDEVHLDRPAGIMGHKRIAARLRAQRFDAAVLFTNSFSTALVCRLAGIPSRLGYDRDARGLLLTDRLTAPLRRDTPPYSRSRTAPTEWAPIPACDYYFALARHFLTVHGLECAPMGTMELCVADSERDAAASLFSQLPIPHSPLPAFCLLNPGGNDPAKRWPAERFAELSERLIRERGMTILISGSPAEADLTARITALVPAPCRERAIDLPAYLSRAPDPRAAGSRPLALLKAIVARCALMVTNDTGPRHIAAALGVPVVSLFGPTDHRWTTIPFDRERIIPADPTLPEEEVANDHPERCAMHRIAVERVLCAISDLIA